MHTIRRQIRFTRQHLLAIALLLLGGAVTAGGGAMPWDAGLTALTGNISGVTAGVKARINAAELE